MVDAQTDGSHQRLRRAIEEEVAEAERRIQRLVRSVLEADLGARLEPFVFGWVLQVGPDGVPHFREFGPPARGAAAFEEVVHEPLWTSHIDGPGRAFRLRVELPGVDRDAVVLRAGPRWIRLEAHAKRLRYQLKVPTPVRIDPTPVQLHFQDGALEVRFHALESFKTAAARRRIHTGGDFR